MEGYGVSPIASFSRREKKVFHRHFKPSTMFIFEIVDDDLKVKLNLTNKICSLLWQIQT